MKPICENCFNNVPPSAKFCPKCGADLTEETDYLSSSSRGFSQTESTDIRYNSEKNFAETKSNTKGRKNLQRTSRHIDKRRNQRLGKSNNKITRNNRNLGSAYKKTSFSGVMIFVIIIFIVFIVIIIGSLFIKYDSYDKERESFDINLAAHYVIPMIFIEGGEFDFGCNNEESGNCFDDQFPKKTISIEKFYMSQFEISKADFYEFYLETDYITDSERRGWSYYWSGYEWEKETDLSWHSVRDENQQNHNEYPVTHISWNDAKAFCEWYSEKTGHNYDLPTEVQWEYAAKGGVSAKINNRPYYKYSGSDSIDDVAWHWANSSNEVQKSGIKNPNELGLFDMSGNVWEWCQDWYQAYPGNVTENISYGSIYKVARGGSFQNSEQRITNTYRARIQPDDAHSGTGFRIVRNL